MRFHWDVFFERRLPHLAAVVLTSLYAIAAHRLSGSTHVPPRMVELLNAGINVAGVTLGFLATLRGFLFSMAREKIIQQLRDVDQEKPLYRCFGTAIRWCVVTVAISVLGLFMDVGRPGVASATFVVLWIFCALEAAFTSLRVIWLMGRILQR